MVKRKLLSFVMVGCLIALLFNNGVVRAVGGLTVEDLTTKTKDELVSKLMGEGITPINIKITGDKMAAGIFAGGDGIIGFNDGIVLGTGKVKDIIGPNDDSGISTSYDLPGDTDLDILFKGDSSTYDSSALEFDFVPQTDLITFKYVLSSEEYNEYSDEYADLFGLFVNGVNVAYLPTNPPQVVAITNVKKDKNSQYYINNDIDEDKAHLNTQMDGLTVVLTATAQVKKGQTNHMKFVIADYMDDALDSNVLIKAGSFKIVKYGELGLGEKNYSVSGDTVTANVKVNRTNGSDGNVSAQWTCTGDTATPTSGTVSFAEGETSKTISVNFKVGQTVILSLVNPSGGVTINSGLSKATLWYGVMVNSVTSNKVNGYYKEGETIPILIKFNGKVTVTGTPALDLNSNGTAVYSSGSGSDTLTFNYIVKAGENSKDLDYKTINSLNVNSGTINDATGNTVKLTLPEVAASNALGGSKNIIIDTTVPIITLNVSNEINVYVDEAFLDPGFKALDNIDGDITSKVAVSGEVNTKTAGKYTLKYNVKDAAGNSAQEVSRIVNIIVGMPNMEVSPVSKSYGTVNVGSKSSSQLVTVKNIGHGKLNVSDIKLIGTNSGEFKVQDNNCANQVILPGQSKTFVIIFEPTSKGTKTATATIASNDLDTPSFSIALNGTANPQPTLPQTGYMIDNTSLMVIGILSIIIGLFMVIARRSKEKYTK